MKCVFVYEGTLSNGSTSCAPISSKKCVLSIVRKANRITLGGLLFSPMIGGMVIPITNKQTGQTRLESLHVRVVRVMYGSSAYKLGITTQMFLTSMALVQGGNVATHVLMTASQCRDVRTPQEKESDMWRHPRDIPDENKINLELMINQVDIMLTTAMTSNKQLEVELVLYKQ